MNQSSQPLSNAVEQHQQALQKEQQSISEVVQYPFKQAVELQQNTAQILLSGMELTDATQRMGLDLTRSMLQGYLQAVEGSMAQGEQNQQTQSQQPRTGYASSPSPAPQGTTQQTQPTGQFQQSPTQAPNQFQQPPAQTGQSNQFQQPPAQNPQSNQFQQPSGRMAQSNQPPQLPQSNQSQELPEQGTTTNQYEQDTDTSRYEQGDVETPPQQY